MILLTLYIYRGPYHIDIYIIPCKAATCTWYYSRIFLSIFYFPSCVLLSFYVVKPSLSKLKYARAWITPSQLVIFMCRQMKFILLLFNLFIKSCGCIFLSLINATDYVFPFFLVFFKGWCIFCFTWSGKRSDDWASTSKTLFKPSFNHANNFSRFWP